MRLGDLTKNIANLSEEELLAHVESVRRNKYVVKPAVQKRKADVVKKEKNTAVRGVNKVLDSMTDEQKQQLLLKLMQEENKGG